MNDKSNITQEDDSPQGHAVIMPGDYSDKQRAFMVELGAQQDRLQLNHWRIYLLHGNPPDPSNLCSIIAQPGYQSAGVFVRDDAYDMPEAERIHAIIHELIHLHFERACSALDLGLQIVEADHSTRGALDQIGLNHHLGIEQGVEGLARVLSSARENKIEQNHLAARLDELLLDIGEALLPIFKYVHDEKHHPLTGARPPANANGRMLHAYEMMKNHGYLKEFE